MRITAITRNSYVNGPGRRNVLHVQGCTIGCQGCFNPQTWDPEGGKLRKWFDVYKELINGNPDGVTISGGEPTEQWSPVSQILDTITARNPHMTKIMYTGLTKEQLTSKMGWPDLKPFLDLVVAGPYMKDLHCSEPLRGSANQELIFLTNRITETDLADLPQVEVHLDGDTVTMSGFPTRDLRSKLAREMKR
jgi:anaerobic ribonucleoside-triphosphate reductase activating protein